MYDIIIKNGLIIDGTGENAYESDIAINDDKIIEIGELSEEGARKIIDAKGKYVTPGFIDMANKSDTRWRLFKDPYMESLLHQGITTIIGGNSGASLAPIYNDEMIKSIRKWTELDNVNVNWHSVKEFLNIVKEHRLSVNFGTFIGYGTLRRGLLGDQEKPLEDGDRASIKKHVLESLDQGALGVTTGLIYSHERGIDTDELSDVAKLVAKKNKLFVAHLRDEYEEFIPSLEEVAYISKESGAQTHITHLKVMQKDKWSEMSVAINKIQKSNMTFDLYPYTTSVVVLYTLLPRWVSDGGRRMMLERLKNKKLRQNLVDMIEAKEELFANAVVAHTMRSDYFCGKTFEQIAQTQNIEISEAVVNVLLASEGQVSIFIDKINEDNIERGLRSNNSIVSAHAVGFSINGRNSCLMHPRSFGAYARLFEKYVKDKKVLTIEQATHKLTGKAVEILGIKDRGYIKKGQKADVVILNLEEMREESTVKNPYKYATGIETVIINGQVAIKYGKYTGVRAGAIVNN